MKNETYYGLGGNTTDENSAFAKLIETPNSKHYFILLWKGIVFDPYGAYILKRSDKDRCKFKKVTESAFNLYVKYLKTKNSVYYARSQRETIGL